MGFVGPRIFPDEMIIAEAGRSMWVRYLSPFKAPDIARILNGESGPGVFTDFYIGAGLVASYFLSFDEIFGRLVRQMAVLMTGVCSLVLNLLKLYQTLPLSYWLLSGRITLFSSGGDFQKFLVVPMTKRLVKKWRFKASV